MPDYQPKDSGSTPAVTDLKRGIEAALDEIGYELEIPEDFVGVRGFYKDNIKVNKLAYRAIEHFNLPVLRTWFRYGQWEPYNSLRPKRITPDSLSDPHSNGSYNHPYNNPPTKDEIRAYLISQGIKRMMQQGLFEFLQENYEELAPKPVKGSYLANLEVLEVLEDFWHDSNPMNEMGTYKNRFREASMNLQYQIDTSPYFDQETYDHVETGLFAIEDVFVKLESKREVTERELNTARQARTIYHNFIWTIPAFDISIEEVDGPQTSAEEFREKGRQKREQLWEDAPQKIENWKAGVRKRDLRPTGEDYREVNGEVPTPFVEFEDTLLTTGYE